MPLSINGSYPGASGLTYTFAVDDDNQLKDLITPARVLALNATAPNGAAIGAGARGRHVRTGGSTFDPRGFSISAALASIPNVGTIIMVTNGCANSSDGGASGVAALELRQVMPRSSGSPLTFGANAAGNATLTLFNDWAGAPAAIVASVPLVDATPRVWIGTRDNAGNAALYRDGVLVASGTLANTNGASSGGHNFVGGVAAASFTDISIVYLAHTTTVYDADGAAALAATSGAGGAFGLISGATPPPPVITGPTTFNLAENDTTSGPLFSTDVALGSGYPTKTGTDQALFNLVSVGTNQWRFVKIAGGNFEGPDDAGANRVYDVTFNASASVSATCAITLTNVAEPPGAPTIGVATAGDATVTLAGTAPAANGGPSISSYLATLSPGGLTKTSATLPITLTGADGVVNGTTYTGTLRAINSEGTSPASAASNAVTPSSAPAPVRTVRTLPFSRNPGNGARPVSLPNNSVAVLADAAGLAPIVNQAGIAMGSDGRVQLDSSSLPAIGTSVVVVTREADGKLGVERYQVQ